jgi:hypothetical protein
VISDLISAQFQRWSAAKKATTNLPVCGGFFMSVSLSIVQPSSFTIF